MRLKYLMYACALLATVASCSEKDEFPYKFTDPRDGKSYHQMVVAGLTWMREDLHFQDSLYSYQQALAACPPGWSLPTQEDWAALGDFYGGYETYNSEVGSPSEAYKVLVGSGYSGFGASKDFYWTSTPAWIDGSIVRSYSFGLDSISKRAILAGKPNSSKLYCRCVKRKPENRGENFVELNLQGEAHRFDLYPTFFPPKYSSGKVALYLYKDVQADELINRLMLSIQLPGQYVEDGEPKRPLNSRIDYQVVTKSSYNVFSFDGNSEALKLDITKYDGKTLEGTFEGHSSGADSVSATGGVFKIALGDDS